MYKLTSISNRSLSSLHASSVSRLARLTFCLALLATLGMSHATAAVYEPFDYTGSVANGTTATGDGFTGNWTCGAAASVVSGLTYPNLPVANGSLSSTSGRQSVNLATPLSSGTKWISFLFNMTGNNGGNYCGVYFANGGTGLFFGYGFSAISSAQGKLGLGSINTVGTATPGAASLASTFTGTYGSTPYLVVLKIDFNTSGADTVTVYINPVANQETPGVAATYTVTTFDVGTITGIGFQNSGGGFPIVADEIRVGDTYADAIAAVTAPPDAPSGLNAVAGTNHVSLSWTAATGIPASYNVKRASSSGGPYTNIIGTTTVPTVTYEDAVIGGQIYYYVVSAVNVIGEGADSAYVAASPILAAPDAPTGLSASPADSQVVLSWTGSAFATGYTVKRATDIAGPYSTIGTTTDPVVTYDDTVGLVNATTYYYVVAATGAGGSSSDTSPVSATPFGPMPFVMSIDHGLGIAWFASNSVTYQVQWASEDLGTNTVWYNLGESIPGSGETNVVFDPVAEPHNYYRVLSIE